MFAQWLREQGIDAEPITTEFGGDEEAETIVAAAKATDELPGPENTEASGDESVH